MRLFRSLLIPVAMTCAIAAGGAAAQTAAPEPAVAPTPDADLFTGGALDEHALSAISGRENSQLWQSSNAQSSATVKDNKIGDNSTTGAIGVTDSAFQNVSGISMVNMNTGNASSINATMNVNLSISMAPPATPGGM